VRPNLEMGYDSYIRTYVREPDFAGVTLV
jgi:hypothetical protein